MNTMIGTLLLTLASVSALIDSTLDELNMAYVNHGVTDTWCYEHHFGSTKDTCVHHNGCCWSDAADEIRNGMSQTEKSTLKHSPCHSCKLHEAGWCKAFGEERAVDYDLQGSAALGAPNEYLGEGNACLGYDNSNVGDVDRSAIAQCAEGLICEDTTDADKKGTDVKLCEVGRCECKPVRNSYYCNQHSMCEFDLAEGKCTNDESNQGTIKEHTCDTQKKDYQEPTTEDFPNKNSLETYKKCVADYDLCLDAFVSPICEGEHADGKDNRLNAAGLEQCKTEARALAITDRECLKEHTACRALYYYDPVCCNSMDAMGCESQQSGGSGRFEEYVPAQTDSNGQFFCVDAMGHEIPNTRRQVADYNLETYRNVNPNFVCSVSVDCEDPNQMCEDGKCVLTVSQMLFREGVDCVKERKTHEGYQCPNAITLTTKGGTVIQRETDKPDWYKATSYLECNTDKDCQGEEHKDAVISETWCCSNGQGRECKKPVMPLAGCKSAEGWPNKEGVAVTPGWTYNDKDSKMDDENHDHGKKVTLACEQNWYAEKGPQKINLECVHGYWHTDTGTNMFSLSCVKGCETFDVSKYDGVTHANHYIVTLPDDIEGQGTRTGSKRTISCPENYGVVGEILENDFDFTNYETYSEDVFCKGSKWKTAEGENPEIRCDVCFDDPTWREKGANEGRACSFYATRPKLCPEATDDEELKGDSVRNACRKSCGTCKLAEKQFKNRDQRREIPVGKESKWTAKTIKVTKVVPTLVPKTRTVKVTKFYSSEEICWSPAVGNGKDTPTTRATLDDKTGKRTVCPQGSKLHDSVPDFQHIDEDCSSEDCDNKVCDFCGTQGRCCQPDGMDYARGNHECPGVWTADPLNNLPSSTARCVDPSNPAP